MHKQWNVNTTIMRTMTIVHKFTVIAGSKIDHGFSFYVSMHPVTLVVVALKINVVYCVALLVYIKAFFKVVSLSHASVARSVLLFEKEL